MPVRILYDLANQDTLAVVAADPPHLVIAEVPAELAVEVQAPKRQEMVQTLLLIQVAVAALVAQRVVLHQAAMADRALL
jgi:hypothetical protein